MILSESVIVSSLLNVTPEDSGSSNVNSVCLFEQEKKKIVDRIRNK